MKNHIFIFGLLLLTMNACSNEAETEQFLPVIECSNVKTIDEQEMLSFDSEEQMFAVINRLKLMSDEEQQHYYGQFVSQSEFFWNVVDEINAAESLDQVKAIHSKYKELLIFNDNEADNDISPYIPTSHNGTELVCNKYGNVIIGGEIVNYNDISSYEQTWFYRIANIEQTRTLIWVKGVFAQADKRKFWAEAYYNTDTGWIELKLAAHKKSMFGWNQYKTSYYLKAVACGNWQTLSTFGQSILNAAPNYMQTADLASSNYYPLAFGYQYIRKPALFVIDTYSRGVDIANAKRLEIVCYHPDYVDTRVEDLGDEWGIDIDPDSYFEYSVE